MKERVKLNENDAYIQTVLAIYEWQRAVELN